MRSSIEHRRARTGVTPYEVMVAGGSVRRLTLKRVALGSLFWAVRRRSVRNCRRSLGGGLPPVVRKALRVARRRQWARL